MGSCCGSGTVDRLEQAPLLQQRQGVAQGAVGCAAVVVPAANTLRMHLDENRDGVIDVAAAAVANWTWGAHGAGAIILTNTKFVANNGIVDARCEIAFQWANGNHDPHGAAWTAQLTVQPPARVKLFTSRQKLAGDANLLDAAAPIDLKSPPIQALYDGAGQFSLWIEANGFPASALEADWRVTLTLAFTNTQGIASQQGAELRIAPWLMASDLDPTAVVYAVQSPQGNPPPDPSLQHAIHATAVAAGAVANLRGVQAGKPFLRDIMKSGYLHAPHHQEIAVLRALDDMSPFRALGVVPPAGSIRPLLDGTQMLAESNLPPVDVPNTSQDHGGNLLVTPPIAGFPHGRIVYGHAPGHACRMADFFAHQRVQAPFHLDSSWLYVGHVDEYISFLPDAGHPAWPWKILLMSPRLGYAIAMLASVRANVAAHAIPQLLLDAAADAEASRRLGENFADLATRMALRGPRIPIGGASGPVGPFGQAAYVADPAPPPHTDGKVVLGDRLQSHWEDCLDHYLQGAGHATKYDIAQPAIDQARATLLARLGGLGQDRILEIPVLLNPTHAKVVTDTADSVNMLVLRDAQTHVLVPAPFGPVVAGTYLFRTYIDNMVRPLVNGLSFIDEWREFHINDGEVHCGTNQVPRLLAPARQWWSQAAPGAAP